MKKICSICGKEFEIRYKATRQKYCSKKCLAQKKYNYKLKKELKKEYPDISKMSKLEIYEYILTFYNFIQSDLEIFFESRNAVDIYHKIFGYERSTKTDLKMKSKKIYDFLKGQGFCKICGAPTSFNNFTRGYNKSCSKKCMNKIHSINMTGEKNSCHKMTEETKNNMKIKNSTILKRRIEEGLWTPCITNSWSNSRVKLKVSGTKFEFRSTWEALFWVLNKEIQYEKLRIPYFDTVKQKERIYIVDFIDEINKIVYEVKPKSNQTNQNSIDKYKSIIIWCNNNAYTYECIDESFFVKNLNLLESDTLIMRNTKLKKSVLNFKKVNNENKKNKSY